MEKTLIIAKPDAVQRGLVGRILQRFEDAGLKIVAMKMVNIDKKLAADHYFDVAERRGEHVFSANIDFLTQGPVVALVLEGVEAIATTRKIVGDTEPKSAPPGTIRGDFAHQSYEWANQGKTSAIRNLIHASANASDAKKEIKLWFSAGEILNYKTSHQAHTF